MLKQHKTYSKGIHGFIQLLVIAVTLCHQPLSWSDDGVTPFTNLSGAEVTIHYLEDAKQALNIKQIINSYSHSKAGWHSYKADSPGFGFTRSSYWLAIESKKNFSPADKHFIEINNPTLDSIDWFEVHQGDIKQHIHTGDLQVFSQRLINHRNFVFPFESNNIYFARITTTMDMSFPVTVHSKLDFISYNNLLTIITGSFYGILVVMILYNSLLGFVIKDTSYLYYVLFIASLGMITLFLNGTGFEYLWPKQVHWNNSGLLILLSSANIFALLLAKTFLQVKQTLPEYNQAINYLTYTAYFTFIVTCLNGSTSLITVYINTLMFIAVAVALGYVSIKLALKKNIPASIFLIALLTSSMGSLIKILHIFGYISTTPLTTWSLEISTTSLVILVSIAFAFRYTQIRHENSLLKKKIACPAKNKIIKLPNLVNNTPITVAEQFPVENNPASDNNELRACIYDVMRLSLDLWEKSPGKTKLGLAEESKLWRIYIDKSTPMTRTLDKYLKMESIPKRPRVKQVIQTAAFVLEKCPMNRQEREKLNATVTTLQNCQSTPAESKNPDGKFSTLG